MRANQMRSLKQAQNHDCAPKAWRDVPDLTGDYDLDATIMHRSNKALPARLELYLKRSGSGPVTGYNGYHNYGGDS